MNDSILARAQAFARLSVGKDATITRSSAGLFRFAIGNTTLFEIGEAEVNHYAEALGRHNAKVQFESKLFGKYLFFIGAMNYDTILYDDSEVYWHSLDRNIDVAITQSEFGGFEACLFPVRDGIVRANVVMEEIGSVDIELVSNV